MIEITTPLVKKKSFSFVRGAAYNGGEHKHYTYLKKFCNLAKNKSHEKIKQRFKKVKRNGRTVYSKW